ncbi:MAG: hypothetical protein AAB533_01870 [Patescibacteria group bacterium]
MRIFDKSKYAGSPYPDIRQVIEKLAELGRVVVAVRGPGFSANLVGVVNLGEDGGDPVLRIKGCDCHIHLMWDKIHHHTLAYEDVGYGPAPVIYLLGEDGEPVVNLFPLDKTLEETDALLVSV